VTGTGVLLIVRGALALLVGLLLLAGSSLSGVFTVAAIITLAVGALEIYAGVQVLGLKENGRVIGMVLAAIDLVLALVLIGKGAAGGIIGILIDAFIIYALYTNRQYFHR
jgi:hypothetical protein